MIAGRGYLKFANQEKEANMIGVAFTCVLHTAMITTGAQPYSEAYHVSMEKNRPLLVMVGADWCPACVSMKRGVLARMQRNGKLNGVSFAVVDADRDHRLASSLKRGSSIPQLILYHKAADGWRRTQLVGGQSEATIERLIDKAVSNTVPATAASATISQ